MQFYKITNTVRSNTVKIYSTSYIIFICKQTLSYTCTAQVNCMRFQWYICFHHKNKTCVHSGTHMIYLPTSLTNTMLVYTFSNCLARLSPTNAKCAQHLQHFLSNPNRLYAKHYLLHEPCFLHFQAKELQCFKINHFPLATSQGHWPMFSILHVATSLEVYNKYQK